jgi:hypothetical protein
LPGRARGDCHATCNDCGGGDAEPSTRDEIATGDDWTSVLFGLLAVDWSGWLTC